MRGKEGGGGKSERERGGGTTATTSQSPQSKWEPIRMGVGRPSTLHGVARDRVSFRATAL